MFLKSPKRLRAFHIRCPNIPTTTADSWTLGNMIKAVILKFNPNETVTIKESQTKFQDTSVETDLKTIFKYYKQLHDAIEKTQDIHFSALTASSERNKSVTSYR
ncbi:hypothetical protein NQ318_003619 [Aromia moschata]|uniref:Uncharacterized protein n=1 Tax=Aromia moschata TaxID=1265417 RepID=A0AAV8Y3I3_9CUCU|nr:hypothetical protein NQ318_003619 [Aromia moschata]